MRSGAGVKSLPYNFLLQSTPELESTAKAKPIITQEHMSTIDNMIKLLVLGEYWDNVLTRALNDVGSRRGEEEAPEVGQEKSKLGLGELYEREYLNKAMRLDIDMR